jgi:hypothetical protein
VLLGSFFSVYIKSDVRCHSQLFPHLYALRSFIVSLICERTGDTRACQYRQARKTWMFPMVFASIEHSSHLLARTSEATRGMFGGRKP